MCKMNVLFKVLSVCLSGWLAGKLLHSVTYGNGMKHFKNAIESTRMNTNEKKEKKKDERIWSTAMNYCHRRLGTSAFEVENW